MKIKNQRTFWNNFTHIFKNSLNSSLHSALLFISSLIKGRAISTSYLRLNHFPLSIFFEKGLRTDCGFGVIRKLRVSRQRKKKFSTNIRFHVVYRVDLVPELFRMNHIAGEWFVHIYFEIDIRLLMLEFFGTELHNFCSAYRSQT